MRRLRSLVGLFGIAIGLAGAAQEPSPMIHPTSLIHISIRKPIEEIYNFISNPRNMSEWAAGLSGSPLTPDGDQWLADSPMGKVKIKFAPKNDFGIADHDVTLPNGQVVHNPLRVQKNGDGAEVIFTLYRLPGVSEKDFQADAAKVRADLAKLKALLESDSRG